MKAWELHGFGRGNLVLTDKPIPEPSPTEVLVRVGAVSLNYRDKLLVEGFYNPGMRFPMTQVADAVGQVVEIGDEVTRFRVGDRVIVQYCTRWAIPFRARWPSMSSRINTLWSRPPAT